MIIRHHRMINPRFLLLVVTLAVLLGCRKKAVEIPPADSPIAVTAATNAPGTAAPAPLTPPPPAPAYVKATAQDGLAQNVAGDVDPFLTQQLQIFKQQKGRLPQSFTELARSRLDSVPSPPAGKRWVIDSATAQVKAVKAE